MQKMIELLKRLITFHGFLFALAIIVFFIGISMPSITRMYFLGKTEAFGVVSSVYDEHAIGSSSMNPAPESSTFSNEPEKPEPYTYSNHAALGPIGDWMAGTSVPWLTAATVLIILATFIVQSKELIVAKEAAQKQSYTLGKQRFDSTFYNMVQLHHEIVRGISKTEIQTDYLSDQRTSIPVQKNGREVLKDLVNSSGLLGIGSKDQLLSKYQDLYDHHDDVLGHYFRNLYNLIRVIDESTELVIQDRKTKEENDEATNEERKAYVRIIRAQLSFSELILIFYNSFTEDGDAFKKYIKKYDLLDNLKAKKLPQAMRKDCGEFQ